MTERTSAGRHRRSIAVFDDDADAERAVDRLSDLRFPVERIAPGDLLGASALRDGGVVVLSGRPQIRG